MKTTSVFVCRFVPVLLLATCLSITSQAQQKPITKADKADKEEFSVRIIERDGNEVREIERTYRADGMSDADRDRVVMKLVDSLKTARKDGRRRQLTIIVEDTDGDRVVTRRRKTSPDAYVLRPNRPGERNYRFYYTPDMREWGFGFRNNMDSLADRLNRMEFRFPRDWDRQLARPFEEWSRGFNRDVKPSTIRSLDVYPNNPDRDQLNIRFTAPAKGDITIAVTNAKGKEVARREIKDFSGEFVGQIDLGKKTSGTYFVTVTQNEDGAVKRVVLD
ncbi:hypothetical protein BN8_05717 [Fibrisoma limi BUZ 3]|uniref:Secretion system C-terminal sorting domain-containing protein n=1 Tax=Fibrisoma limi BUZ 3 TaxID=1185876 RepID=I2GR58_9BACT|nr:T9SS type A sorting domain-containing protein [Fibrisoma limi]CCH56386.1 hypothetical protein BN8_05717 [Fibrisoma limi BUZ 3]